MTDTELALQALRNAGSRGVHSFDMNKIIGTDRASARVGDLKNAGHSISRVTEKRNGSLGCRWFLVAEAQHPIERQGHWDFSTGNARWV